MAPFRSFSNQMKINSRKFTMCQKHSITLQLSVQLHGWMVCPGNTAVLNCCQKSVMLLLLVCLNIPGQTSKRISGARNLRKDMHCYWKSQMTQMLRACATSVLNIMMLVSATSHAPWSKHSIVANCGHKFPCLLSRQETPNSGGVRGECIVIIMLMMMMMRGRQWR